MSDQFQRRPGDHLALDGSLEEELVGVLGHGGAVLVERLLERLLDEPGIREMFYQLAQDDPHGPSYPADDYALVSFIAERIESGAIQIGRHDIERLWFREERVARTEVSPVDLAPEPTKESEPPEPIEYVKDWHWQCAHHAAPYGKRSQTDRQAWGRVDVDADGRSISVIEVVPNFVSGDPSAPGEDEVHFYWKDEERGSPPKPELYLSTFGKNEEKVPPAGNEAGYTKYSFKTPYLTGQDRILFFLPAFWTEFLKTTQYRLRGGPQSLRVDVYHPRKYKFTLKMPPLRGYKRGVKLGADSADPRKLRAHPDDLKRTMTEEKTGWGPSGLGVGQVAERESSGGLLSDPRGNFKAKYPSDDYGETGNHARSAATKLPIKFYRDDVALDPGGLLTTIASILRLYRLVFGIIDTIKDYAPQVGFYVDFALEIMTGELAIEWMWKEHTDHRAYAALDVNAKLTLFKVTLEMGIGVSAAGGKLQIFAQIEGASELSISYKRINPDGDAKIPFESKQSITGAIGARLEAGSFVKLEGKGQTGFELVIRVTVGIGESQPPVTFEIIPAWTGISFTGTFSAGAFGVSYEKSGTYQLVNPISLAAVTIPGKKPYKPPHMSRKNISDVFHRIFIDVGTDVLVYREKVPRYRESPNKCPNPECPGHGSHTHHCRGWDSGDWKGWVPIRPICNILADAVLADKGFTQTPKDIEALANSVREHWRNSSLMAHTQMVGRNYVKYHQVKKYLAGGTVYGCSFKSLLALGQQDPMLSHSCG